MKIDEKNIITQHQKKDLKDLLIFAYLSIDYKATQTNKHFIYFFLLILLQGKFIKTSIDYKLLNTNEKQEKPQSNRDKRNRKRNKQRKQRPAPQMYFSIDIDGLQ